nr:retinoic acid early-inducible protein 1-epsilon-like [Peromyscus maniculatus bairdii]
MAKAAATWGNLFLVRSLFVLLNCLEPTLPTDTHSLSCNFLVRARTIPEQPWFERRCSVDGVHFLLYDDSNTIPLGEQGKEENAIKKCVDLSPKLEDIFEELRKQLLNMEPVADKTGDHQTLQGTVESHYKQGQLTDASWNFTIGEQCFLYFNPKNKEWRVIHDKDICVKEKWKMNKELAQDLVTFSMGDFGHCLKQFLKYWKEMSRSTSRAPDITQFQSTTQLPPTMDTTQILPNINTTQRTLYIMSQHEKVIIYMAAVIAISVPLIGGILMKLVPKTCPQEGAPCYSSSSEV